MGGNSNDRGYSVAVDDNQNIYITGDFWASADFNPSSASNFLNSGGVIDIFLAKYDPLGNYIWAISLGETGNDTARSVAIDSDARHRLLCHYSISFGSIAFLPAPRAQRRYSAGDRQRRRSYSPNRLEVATHHQNASSCATVPVVAECNIPARVVEADPAAAIGVQMIPDNHPDRAGRNKF